MTHFRQSTQHQLPAYQYAYGDKTASGVCMQSASDYSPFGVLLDGRSMQKMGYRYSFQGQEHDDEVKGDGNSVNYKYRMHDPRVGRFFVIDPLAKKYPWYTPYQFSGNKVIHLIELEGLESTTTIKHNTYFIELKNVDIDFILRKSDETFSHAAKGNNSTVTDYTVNLQQYETTGAWAQTKYYAGYSSPQPTSDFESQGFIYENGKKIEGRSSPGTFYFSQNKNSCKWSCGKGDVPSNSFMGMGGGIPVYVNGLKYGEENVYSKDAPKGLPVSGSPGAENEKYLLQRSNAGYKAQNDITVGKTIIGYNSKNDTWILVVQPNGKTGMTLDAIRDELISKGYNSILSFDGSTSSTLVKDTTTVVAPDSRKNNSIPAGVTFSVPKN